MSFYCGPNRYLCEVLEEMRKQTKAMGHFTLPRYRSSMSMLIEEAQTYANRMEAALSDWDDIRRAQKEIKKLKEEIKSLESSKDLLKNKGTKK